MEQKAREKQWNWYREIKISPASECTFTILFIILLIWNTKLLLNGLSGGSIYRLLSKQLHLSGQFNHTPFIVMCSPLYVQMSVCVGGCWACVGVCAPDEKLIGPCASAGVRKAWGGQLSTVKWVSLLKVQPNPKVIIHAFVCVLFSLLIHPRVHQ